MTKDESALAAIRHLRQALKRVIAEHGQSPPNPPTDCQCAFCEGQQALSATRVFEEKRDS